MNDFRSAINDIYQSAVDAVLPSTVLRNALRIAGDNLDVCGTSFRIAGRRVYAIAIGKAGGTMMAEAESILGERFAGGIAVVKDAAGTGSLRSTVVAGSHPVPDQRSLEAGEQVLAFARSVPDNSLVICLISGGGSALMEALQPDVTLDDLQSLTRDLLRGGASIHELNAVRSRLSRTKAGGLLQALGHTEVVNLIISDVLGDDLATIASGPTVPRKADEVAETVLKRYGITSTLPENESVGEQAAPFSAIVGSLSIAIDAAAARARDLGLTPVILGRSFSGESRHVATALATILADSSRGSTAFPSGTCLIGGGETIVTVRGAGRGGRNTEGALAAAIRLSGIESVAAGFLATDGDDAETGAAGGIVSGQTVAGTDRAVALKALENNDSFTFLKERGAIWGDGPTGTNVNDLFIGIVG